MGENKELVMVGVDWQFEKFKSPFKAGEAHGKETPSGD